MTHIGALELFTIGIGPSSSHTVGPMRAARGFAQEVIEQGYLESLAKIHISLYGSLGATGEGHGTNNALIRGLSLDTPEGCDPNEVSGAFQKALDDQLLLVGSKEVSFSTDDLTHHPLTRLPHHSNGMRFQAFDSQGNELLNSVYYSVGGGFIESGDDDPESTKQEKLPKKVPYPYENAVELLNHARTRNLTIAELTMANDSAIHGEAEVHRRLDAIWEAMKGCIENGLSAEGILPGSLKVVRRAKTMATQLREHAANEDYTAEWLQAFAIAVNEENAAGGRVVTAPTNGAAGIIPAVAYWAKEFKGATDRDIALIYLPTAAAIGSLYKRNASISGAEAGCQGEVGSACSMAAAGVTALMGGTIEQIENAAEIAMEHNLGLTCDPVGGFVQLPCIERNAIAAGTAVAAMRLAMLGDGSHKISLDTVIETMRQTGLDMSTKYKETSMGGLAVNVVEC
jgi:L-serine dehydratase